MAKFLFTISLAVVMASLAFVSTGVRAQSGQRGDYALIDVPDVQQAVNFFRNVLDCEVLDAVTAKQNNALMACKSGMILELVAVTSASSASNVAPVRFVVNDVANAGQWLEREGVRVIGKPILATSGSDAGQILVNFVAPWGLQLQLVGSADSKISALPQTSVQAGKL